MSESGVHLSWESSQQIWVWRVGECKVTVLPWPGLVLGEHKSEFLQESGKEEKELHPGQLFSWTGTATCKRGNRKCLSKRAIIDAKIAAGRAEHPPAVLLTCRWILPSDLPAEKGRKASGFTNCPFASRKCSG